MARRAELLDDTRRLSEESSEFARSGTAPTTGWTSSVITRRELISSVARALHVPERTSEHLIETSRALMHQLRATHAALSTGLISYRKAESIVDHALSIPSESTAEFESLVLDVAPALTNAQLDRRAGRIRERVHPDSIVKRHTAAVDRRCVELTPGRDGMAWLSAHLPAATATAAYNRVTDLALQVEGPNEGSTVTQLRADVFADLLVDGFTHDLAVEETRPAYHTDLGLQGGAATRDTPDSQTTFRFNGGRPLRSIRSSIGRGIRATVHVTVPVMTLLGVSEEPATLEGYGPIDSLTARKLAGGASSFHRILTHPETGAILSVGRTSYSVPSDLRRWLIIRDETCRFPGCSRSARRSEIDHSVDWQYGSETKHDNLAHLCPSHHRLKHQTAWSYTQNEHGRLEWTSPHRSPLRH